MSVNGKLAHSGEGEHLKRGGQFTLPDKTSVQVDVEDEEGQLIKVRIEDGSKGWITFEESQDRSERVSLHGVVQDHRAVKEKVWSIRVETETEEVEELVWAGLYAFWIRQKKFERLPAIIVGQKAEADGVTNQDRIHEYLTETGLGFLSPDWREGEGERLLLLDRSSFWQGAGASIKRHWNQSGAMMASEREGRRKGSNPQNLFMPVYPKINSFTSSTEPPVLTTHPRRPPKPSPGSVIYSRYIFSCQQHLEMVHIDASNEVHFGHYRDWQNSERVNHGWRERGPEEKHRNYLANKLRDPHSMGVILLWDGEPAGYGEISWVKEDGMSAFVGGELKDFDQGTHLLIGEEKFRGRKRFTSCMVSLKHYCFLRDPRTEVVVGEPRYDLPIIPLLKTYLPQEVRREFELPHKRAVFFVLRRDRFFYEGIFE
ncbi:hypothetical protein IE53DRAFT_410146 [Violaceomyces palustris]|uniref:Uncharacterized protein n=1 Tax=Violaceomyces palustris TaxID=1673888 RepID=A0ACD0P043_9BASI|nr:hypothetical protein IE53DRAFT_410146 [Violaceomyces palustris]